MHTHNENIPFLTKFIAVVGDWPPDGDWTSNRFSSVPTPPGARSSTPEAGTSCDGFAIALFMALFVEFDGEASFPALVVTEWLTGLADIGVFGWVQTGKLLGEFGDVGVCTDLLTNCLCCCRCAFVTCCCCTGLVGDFVSWLMPVFLSWTFAMRCSNSEGLFSLGVAFPENDLDGFKWGAVGDWSPIENQLMKIH